MCTVVHQQKRSLLRLTAKDTQFGRGTFSSFLIENAGTLPIKRPKDHLGQKVDNSVVFHELIKSLEENGDMIVRRLALRSSLARTRILHRDRTRSRSFNSMFGRSSACSRRGCPVIIPRCRL